MPVLKPLRSTFLMLAVASAGLFPALADEPAAVVAAFYAEHPWRQNPPGGEKYWTPELLDAWAGAGSGAGEAFLRGPEGAFSGVATETVMETGYEARVLATLTGPSGASHGLNYGMVLDDDAGWRIIEVFTEPDAGEGEYLSELLGKAQ